MRSADLADRIQRYEDGYMVFETAASGDPMTHKYGLSGIDASLGSIIKIGVKSTVTSNVEVFILRNKDYVDKDIPWTPVNLLQSYARSGQYKASDSTYEVVIDMASNDNPGWVGAITGLRFDFVYNNTASTTAIDISDLWHPIRHSRLMLIQLIL